MNSQRKRSRSLPIFLSQSLSGILLAKNLFKLLECVCSHLGQEPYLGCSFDQTFSCSRMMNTYLYVLPFIGWCMSFILRSIGPNEIAEITNLNFLKFWDVERKTNSA